MDNPYLTIVLAGRNDNYGGDFKERLERCIWWTHKLLSIHKISSELIFVNYNPLPDPVIEKFITWPISNEFVSVKCITVSNNIHNQLIASGHRKNVSLLEYPAKNVGIRCAKGKYILCINPDIMLPEYIFINIYTLSGNKFYRANRIDFKNYKDDMPSAYFKVFFKGHSYSYSEENHMLYWLLELKNYFLCKWKLYSVYFEKIFNLLKWKVYYNNSEFRFHCNVSGDFMMMHRDNWHKLRGYNEQSFISLHTDALMVIQAAALGLKENILSKPVYHQEHARRYDANEENMEYREAYLFFQDEAKKMLKKSKATIYNDENWGMNKFKLEEQIFR